MANAIDSLASLDPGLTQVADTKPKRKNDEIGKNEFLTLLITQLKNQDPMNPMESEQFAVNLAQFSQLEQLVDINKKIGGGEGGGLSSLASFLGNIATLNSETISVEGGDGGMLKFDLAQDAQSAKVEILGANGEVAETVDLGALSAGKQTVELKDLGLSNGEYSFRVSATNASGNALDVKAQVAGVVSGIIPGDEPKLIVGGKEVSQADIVEVSLAG